ncbi:hypothetical protein GOV04_00490 [Candidatus Woesearchaeota archaeon]|nr:hypothetical protein [Candidatus Woesearchaeota archaeon]
MKTVFIEAKAKVKVDFSSVLEQLPKKLVLATTVQFIDQLDSMKKQLIDAGINVSLLKGTRQTTLGHMLGCTKTNNTGPFLYVGDGLFHPKQLLYQTKAEVIVFNPYNEQLTILDQKIVESMNKKVKAGLVKFYSAKNVGILVSTKPGQNELKKAIELKKTIEEKDKSAYILIDDTFDFDSLENFNFIDVFVNTACVRVGVDDSIRLPKPVLNIEDLK